MSKICNICSNSAPDFLFEKSGYTVARCPNCKLVYLDLVQNETELSAFYSQEYFVSLDRITGYADYFACENYLKYNFRRRLNIIEKYRSGGNMLDVGCGPGFFLEILSSEWTPFGIDVSPFASQAARDKNLNVIQGVFKASHFEKEFFDAITMWNVFEHFSDPSAAVADAYKCLKPGGILALYTNNAGSLTARIMGKYWHMYLLPDHQYFFSTKNLRSLLENAGFEVLKHHSETQFFSLDYLLEHFMKIFEVKINREKMPDFLRKLLNKIYFPINFFDTVTFYARKKP